MTPHPATPIDDRDPFDDLDDYETSLDEDPDIGPNASPPTVWLAIINGQDFPYGGPYRKEAQP